MGDSNGVTSPVFWLAMRTIMNAVASAGGALASRWLGITVDAETTAAVGVVLFFLVWAFYAHGKRRGWWGDLLGVLALFLVAGSMLACTTPLGAWNATLGTYRTLARGAEVYCSPLNAEADPKVCLEAAIAAEQGVAVIRATEQAIGSGTLTDGGLEAKTDELAATTAPLGEAK